MLVHALSYGNSLPYPKPVKQIFRTTNRQTRVEHTPTNHRRKKMHQPPRHIEDPVTSVIALLISAVLGFLGLLVLMFTLALGL